MLEIITSFYKSETGLGMNKQAAAPQKTRSEQETENEANRLIAQVEEALAAVATRLHDEDNSLESSADRTERAADARAQILDDRDAGHDDQG